jgi:signal peptidase I
MAEDEHTKDEVQETVKKKSFKRYPKMIRKNIPDILLIISIPIIAIFINVFVMQSYRVDGESMETTLQNGDRLLVNKLSRTWSKITSHPYVPKRGEIIVFNLRSPELNFGENQQLIKRVIGLPGDRVIIRSSKITIYNTEHPSGFNPDNSGLYNLTIPKTDGTVDIMLKQTQIFVCGDNRINSEDSRFFGPLEVRDIVGKLSFRIMPLGKAEHF